MLNKVILMGRLTRDPELRHTQSDVPVASFTLAVDRGYSRRDDPQQQTADFVNIVAWRNTAEFVSKWFSKGQLVAVSGRLQVRSYKDRDGNNRTATEVVADECFFAESKRDSAASASSFSPFGEPPAPSNVGLNAVSSGSDFEELVGDDGELPF
ncbi:MAG: single-stranded DNA-binding protein [Oscillospiraceae bacterium]|nr:single-stranded DNA-binding protein [Oscillospiraceae bacterium]